MLSGAAAFGKGRRFRKARRAFLIPPPARGMVGPIMEVRMSVRRVLAAFAIWVAAASAEAADLPGPIVLNEPIETDNPCADVQVLHKIAERFAWAERNTWHRGFVMAALQNGRFSGHPYFEPGIVRRGYCAADSIMSNGSRHTVYYAIEFGVGFASMGNYVDFCVLGLDPWHVHDEACRAVR